MNQMLSITRKELKAYFGSPMAAIFIGTFLLAALFSFFWVETFFARNIADLRPLFRWMPVLMIFLVAALTMRQWSEEQKMGTLEILMTLPVRLLDLVVGKFLAVLALVALALALTFSLPLSVAFMGNLDWGPVIGGFLGALLVAAAYIAIGLFVSSRTDNQIISLIITVLVAGCFYLIGSGNITGFLGNRPAEILGALGTGSRFLSIERGMIDLRDLFYYLTIAVIFLGANVVSLDKKRWSDGAATAGYRRNAALTAGFLIVNLIVFNIWFNKVAILRMDLTQDKEYSISPTTKDLIANLDEPLIMQGFFSERTHPLLAPLVPRIRDLMEEFELESRGKISVSFVDPKYDQAIEAEANQQYGIKPIPFQVAGRYEASVVNSYFNILIKYGDQHVTLGFDDLIEVQRRNEGQPDVGLRNLEYDFTKSIKKVVYGFQSLAAVFADVRQEMRLVAFISEGKIPEELKEVPDRIRKVFADIEKESGGKFGLIVMDPDQPGAEVTRETLSQKYGMQPFFASLFDRQGFFLHLLLKVGDTKEERVYLSGDMGEAEIRKDLEAALKRSSSGFLKTVGIWMPTPIPPAYGGMPQGGSTYQMLREILRQNYNLRDVDLKSGLVAGDVDVLLVVAPQGMSEWERYAIDQFLMRGGAVVALAGNYLLDLKPYSENLEIKKVDDGLKDVLSSYGVTVEEALVMDMQNEPFPIPVARDLGGFVVREIRRINYPFFVDVRDTGMDRESPVVANLPAITMNWASPILVSEGKNKNRKVAKLLSSSPNSWLTTTTEIQPDFGQYPDNGFPVGQDMAGKVLAVSIIGAFDSYFSDKQAPSLAEEMEKGRDETKKQDSKKPADRSKTSPLPTIKRSPEGARLVVIGSSEFINDAVMRITQGLGQDRFLNSLEFVQNAIDWSVEEEDLLVIRSRGSHARILRPMTFNEQAFWEWLNYGIAMAALAAVSIYGSLKLKREKPMDLGR